jgi:hypothetical protein
MSSPLTNEQTRQTTTAELQWALNLPATNVLIIGARESDLGTLRDSISNPVTVITDDMADDLAGTCLIGNALALSPDQQHALRKRLDGGPALRLITLSPVPLYPLVQSGQFDETLYYRLNTITMDLTPASTAA